METRTKVIGLAVTGSEKALLESAAKNLGVPVSSYVRAVLTQCTEGFKNLEVNEVWLEVAKPEPRDHRRNSLVVRQSCFD